MHTKEPSIEPALVVLWGASAIGNELGLNRRQAFNLLEQGQLPARKVGGKWCADRESLRAFIRSARVVS